jgi:predicted dehydrogenase
MIAETKPDTVIVTTVDSTHDQYVIRAMELGCDVITEKPMTTDAAKCQAIIDTQNRTGRTCTVAFNYRYSPPRTQVKDLLMNGTIGEVLSVDFHWMLNTHHGADYFRRWHSRKENSGVCNSGDGLCQWQAGVLHARDGTSFRFVGTTRALPDLSGKKTLRV